jgi:hypothetical protein
MIAQSSRIPHDGICPCNDWTFSPGKERNWAGDLVDMRIWARASAASPENNRRVLISLASHMLHGSGLCHESLRRWFAGPGLTCGVEDMRYGEDLCPQAAVDFVQLLGRKGITAEVYCLPSACSHELVLRVLFPYRPSLEERVEVGDAMGDLMDSYPALSIDLMTLNPQELARRPLPPSAVRVDQGVL